MAEINPFAMLEDQERINSDLMKGALSQKVGAQRGLIEDVLARRQQDATLENTKELGRTTMSNTALGLGVASPHATENIRLTPDNVNLLSIMRKTADAKAASEGLKFLGEGAFIPNFGGVMRTPTDAIARPIRPLPLPLSAVAAAANQAGTILKEQETNVKSRVSDQPGEGSTTNTTLKSKTGKTQNAETVERYERERMRGFESPELSDSIPAGPGAKAAAPAALPVAPVTPEPAAAAATPSPKNTTPPAFGFGTPLSPEPPTPADPALIALMNDIISMNPDQIKSFRPGEDIYLSPDGSLVALRRGKYITGTKINPKLAGRVTVPTKVYKNAEATSTGFSP